MAIDGVYTPPASSDQSKDPFLQIFVQEKPPVFEDSVAIDLAERGGAVLELEHLLQGGSFFAYRGSETLPPCDERVMWLVRREVLAASDAQVRALWTRLYIMSDGMGNYRTAMPMNERIVNVWTAQDRKEIHAAQEAIMVARDANAKAMDLEAVILRRAARVPATTPAKKRPTPARVPPALNRSAFATSLVKSVASSIGEAVAEDVREMVPAATDLAKSYLRQELLARAGFQLVPATGASVKGRGGGGDSTRSGRSVFWEPSKEPPSPVPSPSFLPPALPAAAAPAPMPLPLPLLALSDGSASGKQ